MQRADGSQKTFGSRTAWSEANPMTQALEKSRLSEDKIAVYYDRTWEQFKHIQKGLEGSPGVRLFFYAGVVEVFMPGQPHEIFKRVISSLLDFFFLHFDINVTPTGSVTQEQEGVASVQADDSFCFGEIKPIPDLSIEVIFTSGSIIKLRRYQALGVPEVWLWEDGLFTLHRLGENGYTRIYKSQISELEKLDVELLSRCVLIGETDWLEAMRAFRNAISSGE
ncbi:MAG: Uma2 family endonuclease [Leptolyngbyaceae cyanobacterium bins.302]|nr:Uma2 family endonuclease [Leptolyngbyaceae cyanobacterium bins.302]